jgi:hypothetical protein
MKDIGGHRLVAQETAVLVLFFTLLKRLLLRKFAKLESTEPQGISVRS